MQTLRMSNGKKTLDRRGQEARSAILVEMAKAGVPAEKIKQFMDCPRTRQHINARAAARVRLGLEEKGHVSIL